MLAYCRRPDTLLAPALDTVVVADARAPAYLTLAPVAVMLAYRRASTLLALALDTVVVADAGAPAYLAHAPVAVMLAYRRPATLLAPAFDTFVVADAAPPAVFALVLTTVVRTLLSLRRAWHVVLLQRF